MILQRMLNSIFLLYILMAIPSYELVADLFYKERYHAQMMHISGIVSIQFLVLSTAITPLTLLMKRFEFGIIVGRWLIKRRRDFGLASFYYAALHVIHYVREDGDLVNVYLSAYDFELAVGWIAFFIFLLLAITSNTWSITALGKKWKLLHRFTYLGIATTFIHWFLFDFFWNEPIFWTVLLVIAKGVHLWFRRRSLRLKPVSSGTA